MNNFITKNQGLLLLPLAFSIGGLASCIPTITYPTPGHCYNEDGDARCAELDPDGDALYCSGCGKDPVGCVADVPSDECYSPCGGRMTILEDDSCIEDPIETMDTETSETMSTETETGPEACVDNQDCMDPGAPFCDDLSGECVPCDGVMDPDAACAEVDPLAPLCSEGACVQCTVDDDSACGETTPICDVDANTCLGCSEHEQCPDSACNIAEGNCFDPAQTSHVDGDNDDCGMADGTEGAPYCTIEVALASLSEEALILVHERDLETPYSESNSISVSIAIFAAGQEQPVLQGNGGQPALIVAGLGSLSLRGVQISNSPAEGLLVTGGQAWVEQSYIVNNSGGGIVVDGGGSLVLENSFVGGSINNLPAINVVDGSASLNYTSVGSGFGASSALRCEVGQSVAIRNSILVSAATDDELQCPSATVEDSALEMELPDNTTLGEFNTLWFTDYDAGDFSLVGGEYPIELDIAAIWQNGDPDTDINGDVRPTIDGASDFAGADRIP